jgi:multisubunit Na+/H+ antiporter MnhC subunit
MTPREALNTLDQAASLAPLNRSDHSVVIEAVKILDAALNTLALTGGLKAEMVPPPLPETPHASVCDPPVEPLPEME